MGDRPEEQVTNVLHNLSRQTSLRFTQEPRKVPVWFISETVVAKAQP